MTDVGAPPLDVSDTAAVGDLRTALRAHGYAASRVAELLGLEGGNVQLFGHDTAVLLRRLPIDEPLSTLVSMFLLTVGVEPADAEAALAPLTVDAAERLGIVRRDEEGWVHAAVHLLPIDDLIVACDHGAAGEAPDHVMAPAGSSRVLLNLTLRRRVGTVLDVGTGSGLQALVAARHATRVVATDPNLRALEFARFNCLLNEVEGIELRPGAGFDPVGDEVFDLVVANPPFVISPEAEYLYRDGGARGDDLSRSMVRGAAGRLREDGVAQVLVNWMHAEGDWDAPLRSWVEGLGCDAWLVWFSSKDPVTYAENWNRRQREDPTAYIAAVNRWVDYLRAEGAETIGFGMVILRRPPAGTPAGGVWTIVAPKGPYGPAGDRIERIIANATWLAGLEDEALLAERLERVDGLGVDQRLHFDGDSLQQDEVVLVLDGDLPARLEVTPGTVYLVSRLDGSRTLGEAVADTVDRRPAGKDPEELAAAALAGARMLLEFGLLRRVATSGS